MRTLSTKAILVIDMPSCCHTCRLEHYGLCMGTLERKAIVNDSTMPNYCNLKPLPEKKEVNLELDYEAYYQIGWNECIEEIEK